MFLIIVLYSEASRSDVAWPRFLSPSLDAAFASCLHLCLLFRGFILLWLADTPDCDARPKVGKRNEGQFRAAFTWDDRRACVHFSSSLPTSIKMFFYSSVLSLTGYLRYAWTANSPPLVTIVWIYASALSCRTLLVASWTFGLLAGLPALAGNRQLHYAFYLPLLLLPIHNGAIRTVKLALRPPCPKSTSAGSG